MVRAPCCEKMGMKKGPWTQEEDQILIDYIQKNGHGNWRALPRHAGLLRCGKSCRLRWTNYLRPDIKRGNFSKEEDDIIIELHELLGNRWSAIAAKLPGRTDNEIKNVWHTHLKKKAALRKNNNNQEQKPESGPQSNNDLDTSEFDQKNSNKEVEPLNFENYAAISEGTNSNKELESMNFENYAAISESTWYVPVSPQQESSNDIFISSSTTYTSFENNNTKYNNMFLMNDDIDAYKVDFPETEESFWSDALLSSAPPAAAENYGVGSDFPLSPLWTIESVQCM